MDYTINMKTNTKEQVKTNTTVKSLEKKEIKITPPRMYAVILHNNNYTAFEIVTRVIVDVFQKGHQEAQQIMWQAHQTGKAVCCLYPKETAELKVEQAHNLRDKLAEEFPGTFAEELEFSCEPELGQ